MFKKILLMLIVSIFSLSTIACKSSYDKAYDKAMDDYNDAYDKAMDDYNDAMDKFKSDFNY
tara:strand:+ start:227 stop:409 length:183 start_codon:yes stop_codon:yes gene_type:complete